MYLGSGAVAPAIRAFAAVIPCKWNYLEIGPGGRTAWGRPIKFGRYGHLIPMASTPVERVRHLRRAPAFSSLRAPDPEREDVVERGGRLRR